MGVSSSSPKLDSQQVIQNRSSAFRVRSAGIVAVAVMCSRILGLAREVIFAGLFGAGRNMDAFFTAFRAPNLLRDLFAEGALSTAFVTVFSKKIQLEGENAAWVLASKMATLTAVFMSIVTILGMVFADVIITILAPGFEGEKRTLTVLLTQIMYPFILLVSLAALVMGMLNARNIFGVPAMASSFFNIGSIAGGVLFGYWLDPSFGERALIGLAIGTLIGGLLQLMVQLPSLKKLGFLFRADFRWRDSGVRQVLGLMVPSVIAGSAVQINVLVNSVFASYLEDGAISWLQYAFRLMQLPLGIFGVAIATVTLPVVSKIAATGDRAAFRDTLVKALRLAVFLTIPSAVGLAYFAAPIIDIIYQRGKFDALQTLRTAQALQFYALGLVGYSCVKVLSPAFYAIERKWTPMLVSFVSIGLNVVLNYLLIFQVGLGHRGLALSTAVSATANFLLLYYLMRNYTGRMLTKSFSWTMVRCLLASVGIFVVCWLGYRFGSQWMYGHHLVVRAGTVLAVVAMAGVTYLVLTWLLKVEEMNEMVGIVKTRILRRFKRGKIGAEHQ